jgi:hypothetical protein
VFKGRPHLMMAAEGWEEIAGAIETWIESVLATTRPTISNRSWHSRRTDPTQRSACARAFGA